MTYHHLPDPHDRTPNQPSVLLQPKDIESIYESYLSTGEVESLDGVLNKHATRVHHITQLAFKAGWNKVTIIGQQMLLVAIVQIVRPDE